MDFDSSSKFISSLAKFLQSLCNGYVEFDNGVEVIGHIYLSVDTGKKIDYILNEKVCKTDENSVTFISNSFHAQPAEKPKSSKNVKTSDTDKPPDTGETLDDNEIIIMDEPESTNVGTAPSRDTTNQQSPSSQPQSFAQHSNSASKRPYSHSFPYSNRKSSKHRRIGPRSSYSSGMEDGGDSLHSDNSINFLSGQETGENTLSTPSEADMTHLSQVFPQSLKSSLNSSQNLAEDSKDIKPVLDNDMNVVNVKQEYGQSAEDQGEEGENYYESDTQGGLYSDPNNSQYYAQRQSQKSNYDPVGGMGLSDMYQGASGVSGEGGAMVDSAVRAAKKYKYECELCGRKLFHRMHYVQHKNAVHYKLYPYSCSVCGKKFAYRESFLRHCRFKARHQCELCGKQCRDKIQLRDHKNSVHFKILPFHCDCGKSFAYKCSLVRHKLMCIYFNTLNIGPKF